MTSPRPRKSHPFIHFWQEKGESLLHPSSLIRKKLEILEKKLFTKSHLLAGWSPCAPAPHRWTEWSHRDGRAAPGG
jgi:hypothetical protein